MKIDTTIDSAIVDFEQEQDIYSGKKLFMQGEQFAGGFAMLKNRSKWLICDDTGAIIGAKPVSGYAEERIIPYLIEEAEKQEFKIEVWDGEKSK